MSKSKAVLIADEFLKLKFLKDRTPETTAEESKDAFALLADYRDGGIFIAHYSGFSEWEMHLNGDEFVQIMAGETTLILLQGDKESCHKLSAGQFLVVPQGVWHRFESPTGVKVMAITPQPTQHSTVRPISA